MKPNRVAIIGAGPAGLYSTLLLKNFEGEVHLFDQNTDVGEKLKLTGGGRMNVTNHLFGVEQFSSTEPRILKQVFKSPHVRHREALLTSLGVEYTWEKNRAILKSQNAVAEVARLKQNVLTQPNAQLHLQHKAIRINSHNQQRLTFSTPNGQITQIFDAVILSGGAMYRLKDLGQAEKIYTLPLQLGHTITTVSPSLSPLVFKDPALRKLQGLSFTGQLTDCSSKKSVTDDMIITHFGLSGPAILDFSAVRNSEQIELNFIPQISEVDFRQQIDQKRHGSHRLRTFLRAQVPHRLADFLLEQASLNTETIIADLPKAKLKTLLQSIFHYPIPPCQTKNYPSSWTTKGGVNLAEINPATLESKLSPGVFFAGEILDIDGLCGGYNISWAAISAAIITDFLTKQKNWPSVTASFSMNLKSF